MFFPSRPALNLFLTAFLILSLQNEKSSWTDFFADQEGFSGFFGLYFEDLSLLI